ncbi:GDSL esterase/lipase At4g26790-like [Curcuma longa]|uniref:GDSL esterase/lipase At4g26790-like n=1 Tax=Curcuma longa TaxID=136217 RepID=UPI003D9FA197
MGIPVIFLLLILLLYVACLAAASSSIPALIVFGDSTVDTGNNNHVATVLRSNFRPYGRDFFGSRPTGRFCNGRLAPDFISEALGLPPLVPAYLDPEYSIEDFAKGVCFASAGTGLDNATSDVLSVIPLWKEVEYFEEYRRRLLRYAGKAEAMRIVGEAVYIISIGTNDFLENYYLLVTGRFLQFTVEQYQDFLMDRAEEFLRAIYRLGARKISFTGLGAIGCVPLERTTNALAGGGCVEEYNKAARGFNVKLQRLIGRLCATLPGFRLRYAPVYDGLLHIIANPSSYGIENVDSGCCATGRFEMGYLCDEWSPFTCPDANKYVFWDAFHPTEKVNWLMAKTTLETSLAEFI